MKRALPALLVLLACGGATPPATKASTAPTVTAPTASVSSVRALPLLRPDPETGAIELEGARLEALGLRVDTRGVRGELPKLGRPLDPRVFDLGRYGDDKHARVFVAPAPDGTSLDDRRRLVLASFDAGEGHFRAVEGDDDGFWDGAPAFDPRAVFAELAGVRTALRERYKLAGSHVLYTVLFSTPVERPVGRFHIQRVPGALLLEVNPAEPYGTALRITLSAALVQEMWDLVRDPKEAPSDALFGVGFARAYTRELLRRFGTLSAKDVADDLNAMTETFAEGAAFTDDERRALAGDRFGFDAARSMETRGGLLELVDALYADARAGKAAFTTAEILARLRAKDASLAPLDRPPAFKAARFACFDAVSKKVVGWTFPFAWESSWRARVVQGAAANAPVHDGERIVKLALKDGTMTITVVRDGAPVDVAIGGVRVEQTLPEVTARRDVSDAACRDAR